MSTSPIVSFVKRSIGRSIALSIFLIAAGILAIVLPRAAGIAVNILVAWLLVFAGFVHFVFAWLRPSTRGFLEEVLLGLLFAFIGVYLLTHREQGLSALTLALALYLFVEAILEFVLGFSLRPLEGWGWLIFDGILAVVLGVMILRTWPSSAGWVIGLLVGISLLFSGVSRLAFSLHARSVTSKMA